MNAWGPPAPKWLGKHTSISASKTLEWQGGADAPSDFYGPLSFKAGDPDGSSIAFNLHFYCPGVGKSVETGWEGPGEPVAAGATEDIDIDFAGIGKAWVCRFERSPTGLSVSASRKTVDVHCTEETLDLEIDLGRQRLLCIVDERTGKVISGTDQVQAKLIGEKISLHVEVSDGSDLTDIEWIIPDEVKDYTFTIDTAWAEYLTDQDRSQKGLKFYYTKASLNGGYGNNLFVVVRAKLGCEEIEATAFFKVQAPIVQEFHKVAGEVELICRTIDQIQKFMQ